MFYILKMLESLRKKEFQLKVNCSFAIAITSFVFKKKNSTFQEHVLTGHFIRYTC